MERGRLTGLDGLRGVAALAVLLHHVFILPTGKGYLAVDFFFMLSGYVMARTFEARMAEPDGCARFMRDRVARLYPVIFVASLFCMPWVFWHAGDNAWWIIALNLLLIPTPALGQIYMLNPPAWSILLELFANLVHGLGLHRLGKRAIAICLGLAVPVLAWLNFAGMATTRNLQELLLAGPVRVLVPYGIGILLYRLWRDRPPIAVPAVVTWGAMPLYFVLGSLAPWDLWWANVLFVVGVCPLLIAGGLRHGNGSRLLALLGEMSFPLYAIHAAVVLPLKDLKAGWAAELAGSLLAGLLFTWALRACNRWQRARRNNASGLIGAKVVPAA
ncbi:MAG: acyltransferase family protein [Novosphingobium sp.]